MRSYVNDANGKHFNWVSATAEWIESVITHR